jgi:N6-L-threonylcarbamoyladenine synthase
VFLGDDAPQPDQGCPLVALLVSGGHTCLVQVDDVGQYRLLGQTIDDAAGEAFDKGANLLGLGYPGGPAIEKAAAGGQADYVRFPRGRQRKQKGCPPGLDADLCFSFSGVKTALLYYLRKHPLAGDRGALASVAASYQEAIVAALVGRCASVTPRPERLAAVGGVSLNARLRTRLQEFGAQSGVEVCFAPRPYCADNAAMIAALAGAGQGSWGEPDRLVDIDPNMSIGDGAE